MTHSRRDIMQLMEQFDLRPSRALGQNFVVDPNTVRKIAFLAHIQPGERVFEIGAGLGSLTLALAEVSNHVTAIEVDKHLLPILRNVLSETSVEILEQDATTIDWQEVLRLNKGAESAVVVANLPYNVGTTIVTRILDDASQIVRMLVMVQREVGERLVAGVGDDAYGSLSVKIAYHADAKIVGRVPPTVFVPQPDVESVLVEIRRRETVAVDPARLSERELFLIVRAGFAQRRKMLRRALNGVVDASAFERAGIDPTARAEELNVVQWGELALCQKQIQSLG